MSDAVADTSPLQYLHQLGLLSILPQLFSRVLVPPAVAAEVADGIMVGIDLPALTELSWIQLRTPVVMSALPTVSDLGSGETQVLALASQDRAAFALLDDALARRIAALLRIRVRGTLGILLDAKKAGLIASVRPNVERLTELRFRMSDELRAEVLRRAREE